MNKSVADEKKELPPPGLDRMILILHRMGEPTYSLNGFRSFADNDDFAIPIDDDEFTLNQFLEILWMQAFFSTQNSPPSDERDALWALILGVYNALVDPLRLALFNKSAPELLKFCDELYNAFIDHLVFNKKDLFSENHNENDVNAFFLAASSLYCMVQMLTMVLPYIARNARDPADALRLAAENGNDRMQYLQDFFAHSSRDFLHGRPVSTLHEQLFPRAVYFYLDQLWSMLHTCWNVDISGYQMAPKNITPMKQFGSAAHPRRKNNPRPKGGRRRR